jgi:conjugal transfer pilus assembly protein TraF
VLKRFSERYGFSVIPISLDGQGSEIYPNPSRNHYLARKMNVSAVPAIYLVDPITNSVSAIGFGYNDWSSLVEKVIYADDRMKGDNVALKEVEPDE